MVTDKQSAWIIGLTVQMKQAIIWGNAYNKLITWA